MTNFSSLALQKYQTFSYTSAVQLRALEKDLFLY